MSNFFDKCPQGYAFDDLLLVPDKSNIQSRSKNFIDIRSTIVDGIVCDIPIISANMNTVTGSKMAKAMTSIGCGAVLHRYSDQVDNLINTDRTNLIGVSLGVKKDQVDKLLSDIYKYENSDDWSGPVGSSFGYFVIDVAHGHHQMVLEMIKHLQSEENPYSSKPIIAGNVCTAHGALELAQSGVSSIKSGIGCGCFVPDSLVLTEKGLKKIKDIEIGDKVYTHRGRLKKVKGTMKRNENKRIISINGIKCTKNHEFYVLHKKHKDIVNDENIDEYAEWIPAEEITKNHLLLKNK